MLVDAAEDVMQEALDDEDTARADSAARFILERMGKVRGWGTPQNATANMNLNFAPTSGTSGALAVRWEAPGTPEPTDPDA